MNRRITYATQLANSYFALQDQNEQMFGFHSLIDAVLGETTEISGFACTPTVSPSLTVNVAAGQIFSLQPIDATDFGTAPSLIPADARQIMKFAFNLDPTPFTLVAPTTPGQSRNDLIQISFQEIDGDSTGLSFFGGTTPITVSTPSGTTVIPVANNAITTTVNVERLDNVVITRKAGTPAATGTQTTPAPDSGFVGAWVVTTTQGDSTISANDIKQYVNAPFINEKLKDKASIAGVQTGQYTYGGQSTGTGNNYNISITPALTKYSPGELFSFTPQHNNTGPSTINVNGLGVINIVDINNTSLTANQLDTNAIALIMFGGTNFVLLNPFSTGGIPAGTVIDFAGTITPANYLLLTGSVGSPQSVLVANYPDLFNNIGYTWGGSGANFTLPPTPGRTSIGSGTGTGLTARTLGQLLGEETHTLIISEMPEHDHPGSYVEASNNDSGDGHVESQGDVSEQNAVVVAPQGGGLPHNNMQPSIVFNKFIKYNNL